jgi:predicted Ser/Thr protein kinase
MTRWRAVGRLRPGDPRHIAGFEVVGRLGEGGMGVVYLAEHPEMGPAALKFVRLADTDDAAFRARFRREIEAAERVRSPRVARVLASNADAALPWLATAFVDGPTLHEAVTGAGPMSGERLVALAVALADALTAVHDADVVHRDLKPSNILLTPETPVVIDFGIATLREAPVLTRTGTALGTPGWMAPEQVQGRPCGPAADVFSWGLVVGFAASGRSPFGKGPADALFYRVVHEQPDLPDMPDPLAMLVRSALAKDPVQRPEVGTLLARLTGQPIEPTALGRTLADRTAIVPTVVALGWDVEALPSRPDGRARAVPEGYEPEPSVDAAFWYAGEDHGSLRSLAAAFQRGWDDATHEVFVRRDPIWLSELRGFLRAHRASDADRIVAEGAGGAPPAAAMARLALAMDGGIEPRIGATLLTPEGLEAAGRAVPGGWLGADGVAGIVRPVLTDPTAGGRLASIAEARIMRLWRGLAGMERAASIDERWHASMGEFDRLVAKASPNAGLPTPAERHRALATLLLCALHPEHERQLDRRLHAARRTAARRQLWWAQLAADGQRNPAAASLAVMTADRARSLANGVRDAARAVDRERRAEDQRRRDRERADARARRAAAVAVQPRFMPLRRALSSTRRGWVLAVMMGALVVYIWAEETFADPLITYHQSPEPAGGVSADTVSSIRDASDAVGWAVLLLLLLPAMHIATRTILRQGARRPWARAYAAGAAAVDLLLGFVLLPAASLAAFVLGAGVDRPVDSAGQPLFGDEPWGAVAVLLPFGVIGLVLIVRSAWRLGRAVLGRPVAAPMLAVRHPASPYPMR